MITRRRRREMSSSSSSKKINACSAEVLFGLLVGSWMTSLFLHLSFVVITSQQSHTTESRNQDCSPTSLLLHHLGVAHQEEVGHRNDNKSTINASELAQQEDQSKNSRKKQVVAVFFNIYVETYDESSPSGKRAWSILREQFGQLGHSPINNNNNNNERTDDDAPFLLKVYYNTIGAEPPEETFMQSALCDENRLQCHFLGHHATGFENVTLQHVRDYCAAAAEEDDVGDHHAGVPGASSVIYLHNKGSHTPTPENEAFRRALTAAATSHECHQALHHSSSSSRQSQCDACGLYLETYPFVYLSGNMWHARCDYIQQLLPTDEFEERLNQVHKTFRYLVEEEHLLTKGLTGRTLRNHEWEVDWLLGKGRFAWEHWLAHLPNFVPCDVSGGHESSDLETWWKNETIVVGDASFLAEDIYRLFRLQQPAPNPAKPLLETNWQRKLPMPNPSVLLHPHRRKRDIFLLAGIMVKFAILNAQRGTADHTGIDNVLPRSDSWIWNHFPDGDYWKRQFERLLVTDSSAKKNNRRGGDVMLREDVLAVLKASGDVRDNLP